MLRRPLRPTRTDTHFPDTTLCRSGVFLVLSLTQFGDRIGAVVASGAPTAGWALGGLTYAGYNIIGAIVILPVTRHMLSARDAVSAGLLAGDRKSTRLNSSH